MRQSIYVCASEELSEFGASGEREYRRLPIRYRGEPQSVIVFRFNGKALAYLNRCAHMPRELDCEAKTVFDADGERLRCSMHGIVYDPNSGQSMSEICAGKQLTAVNLIERDGAVLIFDKRVQAHQPGGERISSLESA